MRKATLVSAVLFTYAMILVGMVSTWAVEAAKCATAYDRTEFPHWRKVPGTSLDARAYVLKRDALPYVPLIIDSGHVRSGLWLTQYTRQLVTAASKLDVDHIVTLADAWNRGACNWSRRMRQRFANDPLNLVTTAASANRSKGARGPLEYLPGTLVCADYVGRWLAIVDRYDLKMDWNEKRRLNKLLKTCPAFKNGVVDPNRYICRWGFC